MLSSGYESAWPPKPFTTQLVCYNVIPWETNKKCQAIIFYTMITTDQNYLYRVDIHINKLQINL